MDYLHKTFAIEVVSFEHWRERSRKNNFFELVYILDGQGSQSVNYVEYPYQKNGIFLLPAAKCHQYIIKEPTKFLFVRFTGSYFIPGANDQVDYSCWFSRLNYIMGNHSHHPGELIDDPNRRNASERFQDYVIKSKLRIAESRARYTELPLQDIAFELGFTDSSHLNKMMKKHFGKGMREIRKEMAD